MRKGEGLGLLDPNGSGKTTPVNPVRPNAVRLIPPLIATVIATEAETHRAASILDSALEVVDKET